MALSLAVTASTNERLLTQAIEAIFGAQPGFTILTDLSVAADGIGAEAVANILIPFAENAASAADFANAVVANLGVTEALVGVTAVDAAVAFLEAQLNAEVDNTTWGAVVLNATVLFSGLESDATYGAAAVAFNEAVNASLDYSLDPVNTAIKAGGDDAEVTVFNLTTAADSITGTSGDDLFIARIFDNSNSAQSGDVINGGEGNDTLEADIGNSQNFAITLETNSVENFVVRTQANQADSGQNNLANTATSNVQIDAQRMVGTNRYESNNSRADLLIEDVRIEDNQITKDITVAMVATDPGDIDFGVYFDQHSLRNAADTTAGAVLNLNLMSINDAIDSAGVTPLNNNPFDSVSFSVDGVSFSLALLNIEDVDTYAQLLTAVQDALVVVKAAADATSPIQNVTASLGGSFIGTQSGTGITSTGTSITLTNSASGLFLEGDWTASKTVPADSEFVQQQSVADPDTSSALITSTIILDDVGRGSNGGDLVVGGLSTGLTSNSIGVEQFDIKVDRDSILGNINSTNDRLREVFIVNEDNNDDTDTDATGSLTVNGHNGTSNELPGDETNGLQDNAFGFSDVRVIDASAMVGSVNLTAELTSGIVAKYMDSVDVDGNPRADNLVTGDFAYTMGTADDTFALTLSSANLEAAGTTTREDFSLVIDGANGDDSITTTIDNSDVDDDDHWYQNSKENANLSVNGGSGNDFIHTSGAGDFIINAGSGDDTVYADNSGNAAVRAAVAEVQTLTFGETGDLDDQGQVTVTLSNGQSFTTVGLTTAGGGTSTNVDVATAVNTAFGVATGAAGAAFGAANGATAGLLAAFNASIGTAGEAAALAAYNTNLALVISTTEILADYNAITIVQTGNQLELTYGAAYSGPVDVAAAVISDIATDSTYTIGAVAAGAGTVSTLVVGVNEVITITTTLDAAVADTLTFSDGTPVLTLVDTDGNGTISPFEITQQLAATAFTLFDVTASNPSLGTVTLTAKNPLAASALTVVDSGASNATPVVTTAGVAPVAETGVGGSTQTFTVDIGADRTGSVTLAIDTDLDGVEETYNIPVTTGDESAVAVQIAAFITGLSGMTAVAADAAGVSTVTMTFAAIGAVAAHTIATTITDGAIVSQSVVETTKGLVATAAAAAAWVVNSNNTDITDLDSSGAGVTGLLYKAELTVAYSGAATKGESGVIAGAAVAFTNGFESTVIIDTVANTANQTKINQAIKAAIIGDGSEGGLQGAGNVLEELLSVNDGPANTLAIHSLIDGEFNEADLAITITAATFSALTAGEQSSLRATWADINNNSSATYTDAQMQAALDAAVTTANAGNTVQMATTGATTLLAGAESTTVSDNTITLGTGDDVVVLGTDDQSNDTLVYTGFSNGYDVVVNFTETGNAADAIDFSAYLTGQTSTTGSSASAVDIAITLNADLEAGANEVTIINDFAGYATAGTNVTAGYTVEAVTDLVGAVYSTIFMVENGANDGEYKIFNVEASQGTGADFTTVTLIGQVDFGNSLTAVTTSNFDGVFGA